MSQSIFCDHPAPIGTMTTKLTPPERIALDEQIASTIIEAVLDGRLAVGEPLPAERELAEQLAVNRTSLRQALARLEQIGLEHQADLLEAGEGLAQGGAVHLGELRLVAGSGSPRATPAEDGLDDGGGNISSRAMRSRGSELRGHGARWC